MASSNNTPIKTKRKIPHLGLELAIFGTLTLSSIGTGLVLYESSTWNPEYAPIPSTNQTYNSETQTNKPNLHPRILSRQWIPSNWSN